MGARTAEEVIEHLVLSPGQKEGEVTDIERSISQPQLAVKGVLEQLF